MLVQPHAVIECDSHPFMKQLAQQHWSPSRSSAGSRGDGIPCGARGASMAEAKAPLQALAAQGQRSRDIIAQEQQAGLSCSPKGMPAAWP